MIKLLSLPGSFSIGRARAIVSAKREANVVVADRMENQETHETIKSPGVDGIFIKCDVTNEADVKAMIDKTISKYGRLDFCF